MDGQKKEYAGWITDVLWKTRRIAVQRERLTMDRINLIPDNLKTNDPWYATRGTFGNYYNGIDCENAHYY